VKRDRTGTLNREYTSADIRSMTSAEQEGALIGCTAWLLGRLACDFSLSTDAERNAQDARHAVRIARVLYGERIRVNEDGSVTYEPV
jgi:hypothetical protein